MIQLRDARLEDTATIVALNEAVVAVTSPMDDARFHHLFELCDYCVVAEKDGAVIGFVMAMKKGAPYDNGNFNWFDQRLDHFLYIDRIVISEAGRGHGVGGLLYTHVAEAAKATGSYVMAAEMDLEPPNVGSLKFHERYGFVKLGARDLESGKVVSMQVVNL
ncbi:Acetyltransferase (GNAT) family protein [Roseovarius albus]|uniref:Acetyltransferase (GNAT) family protein n=1 Tax=Roseovarius albus TaxID=1247867 RepID=A0A1X6ZV85_9RHOB|nr:GNAT family N-acetyltransferase [Roseovarius albus]SLN62036.1 Acetyltransferase (GNAT) family protein [Roseovarius albus]